VQVIAGRFSALHVQVGTGDAADLGEVARDVFSHRGLFFGMNVGGIPLADDPEGFWILVALVATFTVIAGRWAFRKQQDY
jgi:hypothetical protein